MKIAGYLFSVQLDVKASVENGWHYTNQPRVAVVAKDVPSACELAKTTIGSTVDVCRFKDGVWEKGKADVLECVVVACRQTGRVHLIEETLQTPRKVERLRAGLV